MTDEWLAPSPAPVAFLPSEPVIVADAATRGGAGLDYWIDGTIGFHRDAERSFAVAPNGPNLVLHDLRAADLLSGVRLANQPIGGTPAEVRHASGGPVIVDPETGLTLLVYHGETFGNDDPMDFYSFIGLAVGDDDGSFADLGRVVESDTRDDDRSRHRPVELGPGACVLHEEWILLYFGERHRWGIRQHLGVARARIADVLDDARHGRTPIFHKFTGSAWDEPGLGGRSVDLFAATPLPVMWCDVARLDRLASYVCVFSTLKWHQIGWRWMHATSLSTDGLHWSQPVLLSDVPFVGEALYVSIDSGGATPRTVDGDSFDLYRVRATTADRWQDAVVERVTYQFEPSPPAP